MTNSGLLRKVDAVTVQVPDLDAGIAFYVDTLGHDLRWRNDAIGQAGLDLPDGDSELVLTTQHGDEPNWLVDSTDEAVEAVEAFRANGGVDHTDCGRLTEIGDRRRHSVDEANEPLTRPRRLDPPR